MCCRVSYTKLLPEDVCLFVSFILCLLNTTTNVYKLSILCPLWSLFCSLCILLDMQWKREFFPISLRFKRKMDFSRLEENTQSKLAILASGYAPSSVFSMVTLYSCHILANYIICPNWALFSCVAYKEKLGFFLLWNDCDTICIIYKIPCSLKWNLLNKLNQLFLVIFFPFSNCAMLCDLTSFPLSPITFPTQGQTKPKW